MIHVGVNGYGTIGKRVADAVGAQPDMAVAGVAKTSPNFEAGVAADRGYRLYAPAERTGAFREAGFDVAGTVDDMIDRSDVVVDATPSGIGAENKSRYERHDTPALFQGGEDADVGEASFVARANFDDARGADYVRVVSCNTTGLSRVFAPLDDSYGIDRARVTLVRRGGDPGQTDRGPINDTIPNPISVPSHHGPDVKTVLPDVQVDTMGMKVPTTLMHTHAVNVTLESEPDTAEVRDLLEEESRVFVLPEGLGVDGAGKLKELAMDAGRPRGDCWENCLWEESLTVEGDELYFFQAIHQEADVVPENVDALRAVTGLADREESMELTDETLGIDGELGRSLYRNEPTQPAVADGGNGCED